ncbi:MAG: hypothetical protein AAGD35_22820 [Actinomycetota bacterium]
MPETDRTTVIPSAAYTLKPAHIRTWNHLIDHPPRVGDVVYGQVARVGHHAELENQNGRIHRLGVGSRAVFVFGNRYATDAFEATIPEAASHTVDLVARSGVVAKVRENNSRIRNPTRIRLLGSIVDGEGRALNTGHYPIVAWDPVGDGAAGRSRLILVIGTSMNAGKSTTAAAITAALTCMATPSTPERSPAPRR